MPSIYQIKPAFQRVLRPGIASLVKLGVTPNMVTLSGLFFSLLMGTCIWLFPHSQTLLITAALFQFVRMAFNAIDGMMAREYNMKSPLGVVLNELSDVVSDVFLYYPLIKVFSTGSELIAPVVIVAIIAEMTGVISVQIGGNRRYDGPFGKSDRAFLFGVLVFLIGIGINIESQIEYILWVFLALGILTILNRGKMAVKEISSLTESNHKDSKFKESES